MLILKIGAEGGEITIHSARIHGTTFFYCKVNENYFMDDWEIQNKFPSRYELFESFEVALEQVSKRYPIFQLVLEYVHPRFELIVMREFLRQLKVDYMFEGWTRYFIDPKERR